MKTPQKWHLEVVQQTLAADRYCNGCVTLFNYYFGKYSLPVTFIFLDEFVPNLANFFLIDLIKNYRLVIGLLEACQRPGGADEKLVRKQGKKILGMTKWPIAEW